MELINQVLYLGFGLIFFGLSFNAFHDLKTQFTLQSQKVYWLISLFCMSASCFLIVVSPWIGSFSLTFSSITRIAVDVGLCLLFRSFNVDLKKHLVLIALLSLLPMGVALNFISGHENYDARVIFVSWVSIGLSVWQLYELIRQNNKSRSIYLIFIAFAIGLQILLWLYRMWVVDHYADMGAHQSVFDEGLPELIARLILVVLYALIFIAIGNYYYDKLVQLEKQRRVDKEEQMLVALKSLASARDNDTGNHIVRTQHYVKTLANRLKAMGYFEETLTPRMIDAMYRAAPLHDIGKVGIPDDILLKRGSLTPEEWDVMKTHASIGESVLQASAAKLHVKDLVVECAIKIAGAHHERWDGTGYPHGLSGESIPLEARIMALADMYDALVTERPYKNGWSHEDAIKEIVGKKGSHLDPAVVEAFMYERDEFKAIAARFRD